MQKRILFSLGFPEHGWLPVEFQFGDIHLRFGASDVLNDPLEELADAVLRARINKPTEVTFWLEPAAYFFMFEQNGDHVMLTISETDYWDNGREKRNVLCVMGDTQDILEQIAAAVKKCWTHLYTSVDWPYRPVKSKLELL